jgi:hypothetical protein
MSEGITRAMAEGITKAIRISDDVIAVVSVDPADWYEAVDDDDWLTCKLKYIRARKGKLDGYY